MNTQMRFCHTVALAAMLVTAIGLVGCGNDSSSPTTPEPPTGPYTLLLDGDGAATVVADSAYFSFIHTTLEFTIEAWVRLDDPDDEAFFAIAGSTTRRAERGFFFGYENRPAAGSQQLRMGVVRNTFPDYALQAFGDGSDLADGEWHHVAVVADGAGLVMFYVDGSVVTSTIDAYNGNGDGEPTRDLQIGDIHSVEIAGDFFLSGGIDDVRIWDVARSASEIAAARTQHLGPQSGLVGCWRFDEIRDLDSDDEFDDVPDSSGNGNHVELDETARLVQEELF